MRATRFDWRFIVGSFLLFVMAVWLPFSPILVKLFYTASGLKLSVMIFESLVFLFVTVAYSFSRVCAAELRTLMLFFGWLLWVFISVLLSDSFAPSLVRFGELLCHILFLLSLMVIFRENSHLKLLVRIFLVSGFVLYVALVGSVIFTTDLGPEIQYQRVFLGFHHIRHFGYYSLIILFVVFELLKFSQERANKSAVLVCYALAVAVWTFLFFAGGRGPFFSFFATLMVLFVVSREYLTKSYLAVIFSTMLLGLLISLPLSFDSFGAHSIYERTVSANSLNTLSSSRIGIWSEVLQHSLSSPFFGEGPEGYLYTVSQASYPTTIQPHGLLAQIVMEWGWVGAILFLLLLADVIAPAFYRSSRQHGSNSVLIGSLGTLVAILVFSLIDGVLYHPRSTLLFCVVLALLFSELSDNNTSVVQKLPRPLLIVAVLPLLLLIFLHALSVNAATQKSVVDLNSSEITYLRFFPSALADPGVSANIARWPHFWNEEQVSAEELSLWYRWAENNSSRPWLFAYLNASQLYRAGEMELAAAAMSPYVETAPDYILSAYYCMQR